MNKVANDFLDFTGISLSTLQIHNHSRNWRNRCNVISRLKSEGKFKWSEEGTSFMIEDEDILHDHLKVIKLRHASMLFFRSCWYAMTVAHFQLQHNPKNLDFLNNPIFNYAQMKTIFTPKFFTRRRSTNHTFLSRHSTSLLTTKLSVLNTVGCKHICERRTWLRKQFASA
jgi:hypothetical protein